MKKLLTLVFIFIFVVPNIFIFVSCNKENKIAMYNISTNKIEYLEFEDYVAGVTAAEIDESFAESAIESQAIIARTFAYYFLKNNKSKYENANISNDITEAQAYTSTIPQKIRKCVDNTKGKILKYDGNDVIPYFCSNCGGKSSLPTDVFSGNNIQGYKSVETFETENNSKNYSWTATIEKSTILYAMKKLNKNLASINSFEIKNKDNSNRATTFLVAGVEVNANDFRIAVGSTILKSCLISKITVNTNSIYFEGNGYGHGVGLSQWGANIMANNNNSYQEILKHFYPNFEITNL